MIKIKKNPKPRKSFDYKLFKNGKYYIIVYGTKKRNNFTILMWDENEQTEIPDDFIITEGRNAGEIISISKIVDVVGPFDSKYYATQWLI